MEPTVQLVCENCGVVFERRLAYQRYITKKREITVTFCTTKCKNEAQRLPLPDDVIARYLSGESLAKLGQSCGVSWATVRNHLIRHGVARRDRASSGERNGMFGRGHSEQAVAKIRAANLKQFSDPAARERHALLTCKQIQEGRTGKAFNNLETKVERILRAQGLEVEQQFRLGRFLYDFRICGTNRLVEAHGTFWHADPRRYAPDQHSHIQRRNVANDAKKEAYALAHGYTVEIIWEFDVG